MRTPMPSPRGTNHEGLTLRGGFAYDAQPEGKKTDDDTKTAADDLAESILGILAGKLDDETMAAVTALLRPDATEAAEPAMDAARKTRLAQDFAAGRIGMAAFAAAIRTGGAPAPTAGDHKDFTSMFPAPGSFKRR